jgi:hypothetical protein
MSLSTVAWEEIPSGFEMRVTHGAFNNKSRHQATHDTFSTEEQLNSAIQR